MEAYCVKCREKREIQNPVPEYNRSARPITRGVCPVCGTNMVRIGQTPAHEGMQKPVPVVERNGKLVIVESPAKARTVGRYLGKGYTVKASVGHVRDLLRSSLSIDVENNFTPRYRVPNEKREVVKELKAAAKKAEEVFLATDPDREGEAIAWHLLEAAEIDSQKSQRVIFHEITQNAISDAFNHPRSINMDLVDAQQARRILDRLVGYSISPILWEKVRNRLSAGRVQSVALRLIVEREREIDAFKPVEYWTISAELKPENGKDSFIAKLVRVNGEEPNLPGQVNVNVILEHLEKAEYAISKIKRGERRRKPSGPFITSTLQQEASRKLGFTARKTMSVAQQLYEGLDIGEGGSTGLITYMRTDSTNIAEQAQIEAREFILGTYGSQYVPSVSPVYKTRAKSAQEAHEAIRPTSVLRKPEKIKDLLSRDQFRLYQVIWQRFVASQMEAAIFDTLSVDVMATHVHQEFLFRASGSTMRFPGFMVVYEEAKDEDQKTDENEEVKIPANLEEGQRQELIRLLPEQHFTQPLPRFTEASLVQALEEYGIGRPSTYAPILTTIQARGYVFRENKRLIPTETGFLVNDLLTEYFDNIVDVGFTAGMESKLDKVAAGESEWTKVVSDFYQSFEPQVARAQKEMPENKTEMEKIGRTCPLCGHDLVIRWGRFGKFISCSNFPECRYTEAWLDKMDIHCPVCETGEIVRRKSRKGRIFYGCSRYPDCTFTSWKEPVKTPCPSCQGLLVITNKKKVQCLNCQEEFLIEEIETQAVE